MSSNKRYTVECEVTLTYDMPVYARDEDEAREKAQGVMDLIIETQKYKPVKSDTYVDDVRKELE